MLLIAAWKIAIRSMVHRVIDQSYEIFTARPSVEALRDSYGSYLSAATYDYVYQETGRTENLTANFVATYAKRWEIMILRQWQVPA